MQFNLNVTILAVIILINPGCVFLRELILDQVKLTVKTHVFFIIIIINKECYCFILRGMWYFYLYLFNISIGICVS